MRELSLFTGAGGGILGSKLLGWKTVGYVEWEPYCQRVIRQRIEDGIFDNAPIFGDIRAFNSEGYAESYKGLVDIITGGFPCQPFSVAGKQLGADDPRNMWPETIRAIRTIRPKYAFLENVAGLLSSGYWDTIIGDLAEAGYFFTYDIFSGYEFGAPIERKRLFLFCEDARAYKKLRINTKSNLYNKSTKKISVWSNIIFTALLDDAKSQLPIISGDERIFDGVANRPERFSAIGNGQIPITMAAAFQALSQGII